VMVCAATVCKGAMAPKVPALLIKVTDDK
jgi:hypothetical protein